MLFITSHNSVRVVPWQLSWRKKWHLRTAVGSQCINFGFFNFKLDFYQEISVVIDKCLVVTKALYFVEHHDVSWSVCLKSGLQRSEGTDQLLLKLSLIKQTDSTHQISRPGMDECDFKWFSVRSTAVTGQRNRKIVVHQIPLFYFGGPVFFVVVFFVISLNAN